MRKFIVDKQGRELGGVIRFKANPVVKILLDESQKLGFGLNELSLRDFPQVDWEEFYQLIGYSLSGYHELSAVSDESALAATKAAQDQFPGVEGCRDHGCEIHCGVEKEEP
jgi:hypothetical protein